MTRYRVFGVVAVSLLVVGAALHGLSAQAPSGSAGTILAGTIKSATGQPLEGMLVTAREAGKTMKTTVFTDEQGQYFFPPQAAGSYDVWAQAVTFETNKATVALSGARATHDFTMKTLEDFSRQLSGP